MDPDDGLSDDLVALGDSGRATEASRSNPIATVALETAAPAIEIDRVSMRCGSAVALEDITLTVRRQEIFGLLGPSGAGKTSLLRAIALPESAHAGSIRLFGQPHRTSGAGSRLAYLPQNFHPPGDLTGRDFVRLTLAVHGCRAKRAQIAAQAEQLELDPSVLRRPVKDYAKGMMQKLGLLALFLADRPLLLLDEPMSGLDPATRVLFKQELAADRARGRTILLSAQIPADHDQLCDRIAILHRGRLGYAGTPAELRARTGTPTLASACLAVIRAHRSPGTPA
jgi:ABC-2 type transport system ATP-binding protein